MVRALKDYGAGVGMASTIMLGAGYAGLLIEGGLGMEMGALGSETMIGGAEVLGTTSDVMEVGTEFVEKGAKAGVIKFGEKGIFTFFERQGRKSIDKLDISEYEKNLLKTNISIKRSAAESIYDQFKNEKKTNDEKRRNQ